MARAEGTGLVARLGGLLLGGAALAACGGSPESHEGRARAPGAALKPAAYDNAFDVRAVEVTETASAFALVESVDAVAARARIGGTVLDLAIDEGSLVKAGERIAVIADERLALRANAEAAGAAAVQARLDQARRDLKRFEELHGQGFYPTQKLEEARATVKTLERELDAALAGRKVTLESGAQGEVLAPVAGTVLRVPVTREGVVLAGEQIALIGSTYVLKLRLPERHAPYLREGLAVAVERPDETRGEGIVTKVYPALADGRVEADISTPGLESRVYGARVRVWTPAERRKAIAAPARYLQNRFGVDFARLVRADGGSEDVVVRRGPPLEVEGIESAVEILAGLAPGDRIVAP